MGGEQNLRQDFSVPTHDVEDGILADFEITGGFAMTTPFVDGLRRLLCELVWFCRLSWLASGLLPLVLANASPVFTYSLTRARSNRAFFASVVAIIR